MKNYQIMLILSLALLFGCVGSEQSEQVGSNNIGTTPGSSSGNNIQANADLVEIRLSDVSGTVTHYSYKSKNNAEVKYFAVKGSDGIIRTAFDACEVCYNAKKGYSQSGSDVVCNNCGLRFKIDDLGTKNKGAGCWPAYLPHEVKGDKIVIKKSDLEAGAYLFS